MGELTAIIMLTPLLMTLISAVAFDERVCAARGALIGLTFAGALVVVRLGAGLLSAATLLPLLAPALNTGFHLVTSRLARLDDVGTMQFYTGCTGAALENASMEH